MKKSKLSEIYRMCEQFCRIKKIPEHTDNLYKMAIESYKQTPWNQKHKWDLSKV